MGATLTKASDVECGHAGVVSVTGSAKLTVGGQSVLVQSDVASKSISNCTTVTNPQTGTKQCTTVLSVSPTSLATKLTVGGVPVVLASLTGATDGVPPGKLQAVAGQSKLTAI